MTTPDSASACWGEAGRDTDWTESCSAAVPARRGRLLTVRIELDG
jgi:hypothetical protein